MAEEKVYRIIRLYILQSGGFDDALNFSDPIAKVILMYIKPPISLGTPVMTEELTVPNMALFQKVGEV